MTRSNATGAGDTPQAGSGVLNDIGKLISDKRDSYAVLEPMVTKMRWLRMESHFRDELASSRIEPLYETLVIQVESGKQQEKLLSQMMAKQQLWELQLELHACTGHSQRKEALEEPLQQHEWEQQELWNDFRQLHDQQQQLWGLYGKLVNELAGDYCQQLHLFDGVTKSMLQSIMGEGMRDCLLPHERYAQQEQQAPNAQHE